MYKSFTVVTSKQAARKEELLNRARQVYGYTLDDIYKCASEAKRYVFERCRKFYMNDDLSTNWHISTFNCHMFTISWDTYVDGNPATVYITPTYDYIIF